MNTDIQEKKQNKTFPYYIGTLLMILSVFILIYIYYPFIKVFIFPAPVVNNTVIANGTFIQIPKIKAFAPIVLDVDPWNETIYRASLDRGIAQAKGTSQPGEKGTIFLFAHSSDLPWRITRYNTAFFLLPNLEINDKIFIFNKGKQYEYRVKNKKIVSPSEVHYLKADSKDQLILQTCYPIGTDFQRLLIFAEPA